MTSLKSARLVITDPIFAHFRPLLADQKFAFQMDGRTDGWTDGRTDGRTDGWTDRQTNQQTGRETDGKIDQVTMLLTNCTFMYLRMSLLVPVANMLCLTLRQSQ